MNLVAWSKSNVDYGRKLVDSAVEGALTGEDEFLKDKRLGTYFGESARLALTPAVIGALVGAAGGYMRHGRRPATRALAGGLLGGAIGFGAGLIWENRQLTVSVASSAWKSISQTRGDRWFEKNPIDYA